MGQVNATELAQALNVSKPRVSQYVSEGKLAGCYSGEGRARRFDLAACAKALGRTLDRGQMLGNGAATRRALREIAAAERAPGLDLDGESGPLPGRTMAAAMARATESTTARQVRSMQASFSEGVEGEVAEEGAGRGASAAFRPAPAPRPDSELAPRDLDRWEMAKILKAEEEARRMRRINAEAEGTLALVSEVHLQVAQQIAQEVGEFETVLREGARQVADRLGVDFKAVRQILTEGWREHRAKRAAQLTQRAQSAGLTAAEKAADI